MKKVLALAAVCFMLAACATPPALVGAALINETTYPLLVTANAGGKKTGKACAKNYLGIFATGDMSLDAAKKAGKITKVTSVDTEVKSFIVIADVCTIVTGD